MNKTIICEIITGSWLYGTNTTKSDKDYQGVFFPSTEELYGLQNPPAEWDQSVFVSDTDKTLNTDRKFYSIKRFLQLAGEGQPGQLELLFAPKECILSTSPEWEMIVQHRDYFLSKKGVYPFIGFAVAQMEKAVLKGESLRTCNKILDWYNSLLQKPSDKLSSYLQEFQINYNLVGSDVMLKRNVNEQGFDLVELAGRAFDVNIKLKNFINAIQAMKDKYGQRATAASEDKYDYKSILHAYRLIGQASELLIDGKITLPRPKEEVKFLLQIKNKEIDLDFKTDLEEHIQVLKDIKEKSKLPETSNHKKINDLCLQLHKAFYGKDN